MVIYGCTRLYAHGTLLPINYISTEPGKFIALEDYFKVVALFLMLQYIYEEAIDKNFCSDHWTMFKVHKTQGNLFTLKH